MELGGVGVSDNYLGWIVDRVVMLVLVEVFGRDLGFTGFVV